MPETLTGRQINVTDPNFADTLELCDLRPRLRTRRSSIARPQSFKRSRDFGELLSLLWQGVGADPRDDERANESSGCSAVN